MMTTPICDFVRRYAAGVPLRLHMPGHKGAGPFGIEALDITEVSGADSLYEADGIIRESEENASALFGCPTFYSTEGSSLAIRAMLYLACLHARERGTQPLIWAGRNAHKTFLSAAALLDLDVEWIWPNTQESYLSCTVDASWLENALQTAQKLPAAVYLTSPDYLGSVADIPAIADVCRRRGVLLLVDNAHGAYLKFLPESRHPIDLGADACCDSAHKTLPVLTGGAYLHISPTAPAAFAAQARQALALFGSTSPSYLILQSLDAANHTLASGYPALLADFSAQAEATKSRLTQQGYVLFGNEPMKLTICAKPYGYTGCELAQTLEEANIVCEFADPDFMVCMLTPEIGTAGLEKLEKALCSIPRREAVDYSLPPALSAPERAMTVRQAVFSASETIPAKESCGRILSAATVGCPPAVPIVVCGERIDEDAVRCFDYYGIEACTVIRE